MGKNLAIGAAFVAGAALGGGVVSVAKAPAAPAPVVVSQAAIALTPILDGAADPSQIKRCERREAQTGKGVRFGQAVCDLADGSRLALSPDQSAEFDRVLGDWSVVTP